jgi:hypothetical protein
LGGRVLGRVRIAAAVIGVVALVALGRSARTAQLRMLAEADGRAARIAAGYFEVIASSDRPDRSPPEMRLLSAAGNLATSTTWRTGIQVWLAGTPLLTFDTTGRRAVVASFDIGAAPGTVAIWDAVPTDGSVPFVAVGGGFAIAALLLIAIAGEFMGDGRPRATVVALGLLIVATCVIGEGLTVHRTWRAAQDNALLRVRRILEITAVGRRLSEAEVAAMAGGLVITPLRPEEANRDSSVTRDTIGASLSAVAARGQAWRVAAAGGVEQYRDVWRRLMGWGMLALVAGFVAAALPSGARYLSASESHSSTPT